MPALGSIDASLQADRLGDAWELIMWHAHHQPALRPELEERLERWAIAAAQATPEDRLRAARLRRMQMRPEEMRLSRGIEEAMMTWLRELAQDPEALERRPIGVLLHQHHLVGRRELIVVVYQVIWPAILAAVNQYCAQYRAYPLDEDTRHELYVRTCEDIIRGSYDESRASFRSFLRLSAQRRLVDHFRSLRPVDQAHLDSLDVFADTSAVPQDALALLKGHLHRMGVIYAETMATIEEELPRSYDVWLHVQELQKSTDEVAEALAISTSTVRVHSYKVRDRLREALGDYLDGLQVDEDRYNDILSLLARAARKET